MKDEDIPELPGTLKITMSEPALRGVKQEDRLLVRNITYLLHVCKHPELLCVSWNVANTRNGYEVTGFLDPGKDFEIFKEDLDLIQMAGPLRVQSISVKKTGEAPQVLIRVISKAEPVMMTELEVLRLCRRRGSWLGSSDFRRASCGRSGGNANGKESVLCARQGTFRNVSNIFPSSANPYEHA